MAYTDMEQARVDGEKFIKDAEAKLQETHPLLCGHLATTVREALRRLGELQEERDPPETVVVNGMSIFGVPPSPLLRKIQANSEECDEILEARTAADE